ncbi:ATP synthase subunit delta, mitochondrial [Toxorhynchites rutilus septentrionalis]|uniref:ATP synthase subunit delta, mitochondrial n=1 Tax=Toxorhynchites rutilus septentrionalis TaxID=329112 RepID=UPI0024788366|nr:ATP synthase subunit delta, mitochondrial [Toxorhynchites rutilus septentrionalis]XP_055629607.1 ATP synthase subunit delta, mitochondrial [Toxorhynchites rutilus septentrionalis]
MSFALRNTARLVSSARPALRAVQSRGYADEMAFTLAAANKVFYDATNVRQVDVPSFSGSFGILPKHVPTLAILKPGVVTIYEQDGAAKKVFVSSGTITVNEDSSVQVLAEEAHPVEDLDSGACREILSNAQSQLSSASSEVERAEAGIAVEVAEALVKAAE